MKGKEKRWMSMTEKKNALGDRNKIFSIKHCKEIDRKDKMKLKCLKIKGK